MIRINLLPHRAEKRRARQIQFVALSVISVVFGAILVGFVHVAIGTQISNQERRNEYLKQETAVLDRQIAEIRKLREQTDSLLARKNVVENLQSTRSDVVHLLDQMCASCRMVFISNPQADRKQDQSGRLCAVQCPHLHVDAGD